MHRNYFVVSIIILLTVGVIVGGVYWYTEQNGFIDPELLQVQEPNKAMAGTLAYQQGAVVVRLDGSDWQEVETDTVVHTGDQIATGNDSKAIIEFENGDVLRLGYTTEVTLTELGTKQVVITQISGATYNRVAKAQGRTYAVSNDDVLITALGTAFDVIDAEEVVEVGVIESSVVVDANVNETETVNQGSKATVDKAGSTIAVSEIDTDQLTNDWYTWNKEEDSKRYSNLGVLGAYAGPALTISSPGEQTTTSSPIIVAGTVSDDAVSLTVRGVAVEIVDGRFSHEVAVEPGKNSITVVAVDADGNRTVKEVVVRFETPASETPLTLWGETTADGVALEWNRSTASLFDQYKILRSVNNDLPAYPGPDVIAALRTGEERYTDTSASAAGTYYYRVCEIMTDGQSFCSNVIHMRGKQVVGPASDSESGADRVGLFLRVQTGSDGIKLTWTVEGMETPHGVKVLRGTTANPEFPPRDGDEAHYIESADIRTYTWSATDGKTYHFRVCQYTDEGTCSIFSNNVTATAPAPDDAAIGLSMSVKAESTGVGIWWSDVAAQVNGFKHYKVVRSKTNADLRYPDDGSIAARGADVLSYRDYSAQKGVAYYYRVCAVGDAVYCSNVIPVNAIHDNPVPSAVSLSATANAGNILLSWTQSSEIDFSAYKVVWSQTDSTPTYPADKYLKPLSSSSETSYTDTGVVDGQRKEAVDVMSGTHYYSVCVVDSWDQVACSNVVTVINGVIQ